MADLNLPLILITITWLWCQWLSTSQAATDNTRFKSHSFYLFTFGIRGTFWMGHEAGC